jgi:hypothetical protein
MATYKFVTIVAPEAVRAEFTDIRQHYNTTDKQLMQAMFNLATLDMSALAHEIEGLKEVALNLKEIKAISQGEKPSPVAKAAKPVRVSKAKRPKEEEVVADIVYDGVEEEEFEPLVVDGTN